MPMDRRHFLAAALAATAVRPSFAADDYAGFRVGVQSYTFRKFSFTQAVGKIQKLGLKYVELFRGHVAADSTAEKLNAAKALLKDSGITPLAFGVERFTKNHDANKKLFEFGKNLGVSYFSADPDPDSFESLDKLCEEYKIGIAIHPHGPSGKGFHRWYKAEGILKAVKDHHALIGTCLDTGHLIRSAQLGEPLDPVQQIQVMGARNHGLHLKDHDNAKKEDVIFGDPKGKLDVPGVLKQLKKEKFAGYVSIEYEAKPDEPTKDVEECLAYLKKAAAALA
jgi:inosose dehydratase